MLRKLLGLTLILAFLVTVCTKTTQEVPAKKAPEQRTIKLGVLPIEDNLPLYLAENQALFTKEGVKVTLIPFDSARERDVAMQAGQIDGEIADLVAVALLKKGGTAVRVASIGLGAKPSEGRFALLAATKGNVQTIADLKNTPVAISENSIIEYVTDSLLLSGGLKQAEIKKVAIPSIPARMEALSSGQVEAAVLPDPLASLAEKNGARLIADDTKINLSQTVLLFSQQVIDENKSDVQKVVAVYGKAGQELTTNPAKYRALLIEKARIPAPIKDTYQSPSFSALRVPTAEEVAKVIDWMTSKKFLEKPYTYEEIVDSSLLK